MLRLQGMWQAQHSITSANFFSLYYFNEFSAPCVDATAVIETFGRTKPHATPT